MPSAPTPGARLFSRLLPAAIVAPLVLGWVSVLGQRAGFYDTARGLALFAIATVVFFVAMIAGAAAWLERAERRQREALNKVDAGQRKQMEQALRAASQFNEQIIKHAAEGIAVYDRDLRHIVFNPAMERLTGRSAAEMIGALPSDVIPDFERLPLRDALTRALAGERVQRDGVELTSELLTERRWVSDDLVPLRSEDGEIIGVIRTVRDITGRILGEQSLRESEERTRLALSAARMGVWEMDLETGAVTWSETMAQTFSRTGEPPPRTEREFLELVHPDDQPALNAATVAALHERRDVITQFRTITPTGAVRWLETHGRIIAYVDGKPVRLLGVNRDITEQKMLEEQLRQAQKMEAVGQLAGGVAHDFNNLLTAIHGYTAMVLDTLEPTDPRRENMDQVIRAAERAAGLTGQLLAFSRKQVLQPALIDLNNLVGDTTKLLRLLIGEDIQLTTTLTSRVAMVRADRGQLEQILMNLTVNARDAMPQGGRISIETANVTLDETYTIRHPEVQRGPYVMLAVSDNGVGMDAATRRRIFEPFFTTKERGRGTGLGLATVYGIVKQSEGYIWVYSEPGRGTAFKMYLPQAEPAPEAISAVIERPPPVGSETILLVEDEDGVRFLTRALLEKAGYHVIDTGDPALAEAAFRQHDGIDLLVTDVVMPGVSGPTLYRRLASERAQLRVLYMSGYTDDGVVNQAGLSSDVPFLQKPFTSDGLLIKVRQVLDA